MRAPFQLLEPLIELHPGNPTLTAGGEVGEENKDENAQGRGATRPIVDGHQILLDVELG